MANGRIRNGSKTIGSCTFAKPGNITSLIKSIRKSEKNKKKKLKKKGQVNNPEESKIAKAPPQVEGEKKQSGLESSNQSWVLYLGWEKYFELTTLLDASTVDPNQLKREVCQLLDTDLFTRQ